MNENLQIEKQILIEKRQKINNQLNEKKQTKNNIGTKLKALTKESKGSYSEEKETTEKIYSVLMNDIEDYEEALKEPYFGRVDFRELRGSEESIYIGKKGITSIDDGEEIVVDWRAPVSDLYYSGTGGYAYYKAPAGIIEGNLSLKRKFLYQNEELSELFDEGINEIIINQEEGTDLVDEFLKINLEESRGKKLKEVVATIQKEQNDIIRWPKNLPIIVQGSAGSGKTTIALHRLAYLLYRYSDTMEGKDILVLAPNKLFLDYISEILPNLGVDEVKQITFHELICKRLKLKGKLKNKDEKLKEIIELKDERLKKNITESSRIKGTLAFKNVIDRYIAILESDSVDIKDIEIKGYIVFQRKEIIRLYLKDLKHFPINKRKDEIKRYLNLKVKERISVLCHQIDMEWQYKINIIKNNMEDGEERRKKLIEIYEERDEIKKYLKSNTKKEMNEYFKCWRGITSKDIYINLFNNIELFNLVTLGEIPDEVCSFMREEAIENNKNKIIDEDDLAALLYINFLLEGIEEKDKYMHIVVDEAQDYSPLQIYMINYLSKGNSLTLVGDLAQGIYYYKGIKTWEDITKGVFNNKSTYIQLTQSYRSTVEIIDFANGALQAQNLGLALSKPVLRHGEKPQILYCKDYMEGIKKVEDAIKDIKDSGKTSIAIITKSLHDAEKLGKDMKKYSKSKFNIIKGNDKDVADDIVIIPSYLTKGLEFDGVIIYDPTNEAYKDSLLDQRLLYVSLTRALHKEYVVAINEITNMIKCN